MTDARFSGGSVGLVIVMLAPKRRWVVRSHSFEDGDEIVVDLNKNELNCTALGDASTLKKRKDAWRRLLPIMAVPIQLR